MASCCLEGRPLLLLSFTPSSFEVEGSSRIHLYNWRGEASEVFGSEVRGAIFLGLPLGLLGTLGSTKLDFFNSSGNLGRPLGLLTVGVVSLAILLSSLAIIRAVSRRMAVSRLRIIL